MMEFLGSLSIVGLVIHQKRSRTPSHHFSLLGLIFIVFYFCVFLCLVIWCIQILNCNMISFCFFFSALMFFSNITFPKQKEMTIVCVDGFGTSAAVFFYALFFFNYLEFFFFYQCICFFFLQVICSVIYCLTFILFCTMCVLGPMYILLTRRTI